MERDRHTLLSRACVIKFPFSQRNHFGQGITVGKLQTSTERQQRANRGYKNGAVSVFWYESPRSFNYFINERVPRVVIFTFFFFSIFSYFNRHPRFWFSQSLTVSLSLLSTSKQNSDISFFITSKTAQFILLHFSNFCSFHYSLHRCMWCLNSLCFVICVLSSGNFFAALQ